MAKQEVTLQNFAGGELAPNMYGRYALQVANNGCRRCENFIVHTQGPAFFRPGLAYVNHTRLNQEAILLKFEFNDTQAYQLEFTDKKLRFYKDEGFITETAKTITDISTAAEAVVTSGTHGFSDGDEVYISGVVGPDKLNGRTFLVSDKDADTFKITDIDGNYISTADLDAYDSGGTAARIYELDTPYDEDDDLTKIRIAQNADTAYVTHPYYEPRKLTRTAHTSWTLSLYSRTNDPILDKKTISAATKANPCQVTASTHGYETGDKIIIEGVVGMTELNSRWYTITKVDANNFTLDGVDSTGYTTYTSGGYASDRTLLPSNAAFHESRLSFAGIDATPDKWYMSRSPSDTGDPRYDDFTSGTDADHSVEFTVSGEEVNKILWMKGTERVLFLGTFGAEVKVTGETSEKAIDPTSVNARIIESLGVEDIPPVRKEGVLLYVQRGGLTIRSIEFDALSDSYITVDRNLVSDEITKQYGTDQGIKWIAWQTGRPDVLWVVRNSGELLGLTLKSREDVSGWHRHRTNGLEDKFLWVSTMPRPNSFDQMWFIVEREVDGVTRRYVEYMLDKPVFPDIHDYYTGKNNEEDDRARFNRVMAESQKEYVHLDSSLTLDGTTRGENAAATLTPGAVTGEGITFTASQDVFTDDDLGHTIRRKSISGDEYGRATIVEVVSATEVTCDITYDFDSDDAIPAGEWYITFNKIRGAEHLEGRTVSVVADGSEHPQQVVTDGEIDLDYEVSKCHIGIPYVGLLKPLIAEFGASTGPSQTKPRNIYKVGIKFLNTLGAEIGTDLYRPEEVTFSEMPLNVGDPTPLFTGVKDVPYSDSWEVEKQVYVRQPNPLPCDVQLIMIYGETDND